MTQSPLIVYSDLHLDREANVRRIRELPRPPADAIVILAGDIHESPRQAVRFATETFPYNDVVLVLGNHEHYFGMVPMSIEAARMAASTTRVHVLEKDAIDLGGWHIVGLTLWTDFALLGEGQVPFAMRAADRVFNDRDYIRDRYLRPWTAASSREEHLESRKWLKDHLQRAAGRGTRTVVVTHHAPSGACIAPAHWERGTRNHNAFFASELSDWMIGDAAPAVWCHGHTHHNHATMINDTFVVSNQLGYPDRYEGHDFRQDGLRID